MSLFEKFKSWYRGLPDKKRYVELVSATLTVPVLITVLLTNIGNLQNQKTAASPSPSLQPSSTQAPSLSAVSPTPLPTQAPQDCKKSVGPVEITEPGEGDIVTDEPVTIDVSYTPGEYCSVVWSYRINNGSWSEFTDKALELYGLSAGNKKLELRVKSVVSQDTKMITRNFKVERPAESLPSTQSGMLE